MKRITISLNKDEREALRILAELELRDPRAQAALIIRLELERRGLLSSDTKSIDTFCEVNEDKLNKNPPARVGKDESRGYCCPITLYTHFRAGPSGWKS